jgi:hypothetical protein
MRSRRCWSLVAGFVVAVLASTPVAGLEQAPNTWVKRSPLPGGPTSPRLGYEGACVWDTAHHVLMRYGGHNQGGGGAQYAEVWTFDPYTCKWTLKEPNTSPPGVCCAQQNVYDPIRERYVRFPAFSGSHGWQWFREIYLNNSTIWVYDLDSNLWRNLCPTQLLAPATGRGTPADRRGLRVSPLRCASWDSDAQVIVVFGGEGNQEGTVVYDPHSNTWTRLNPPTEPPFRSAGNMVYDSAHKLHILFGSQFTDDPHTWAYDLRQNKWRDLKPATLPPTKENDAVLAYDSHNRVVIAVVKITEGKDEDASHHLQTWAYDTGKNTWTKMNPPREPDPTGNRARVLVYAPELGLSILENRTRSEPGPPEQQIWMYCYKPAGRDPQPELNPPADVQVTTTSDGAVLKWGASPSASVTGYLVYRGTGEQPWTVQYRQISRTNANVTSYRDADLTRGTVYYYYVRAAGRDRQSKPSIKVRTQPPIVEDAVVSVLSQNQVHLTWTPPEAGDITGYLVERAVVEVWTDDQLKRLKSRLQPLDNPSVGAVRRIGPFERLTSQPLKTTSFRDSADLIKPRRIEGQATQPYHFYDEHLDHAGKEYNFAVFAYRIRAVNVLGVESGPSPYFLTIPSAPRWVFAREDGTTCRLKWAANPEQKLRGYRIYRLDGRWDKDPISRLTEDPVADLTFADPAAGEHSRRYHVVAVDVLGQEGLPSAPVWYNREWKRFYEPFVGQWHQ